MLQLFMFFIVVVDMYTNVYSKLDVESRLWSPVERAGLDFMVILQIIIHSERKRYCKKRWSELAHKQIFHRTIPQFV